MTWDEFVAVIESTSIELYRSEWDELEAAFLAQQNKQTEET